MIHNVHVNALLFQDVHSLFHSDECCTLVVFNYQKLKVSSNVKQHYFNDLIETEHYIFIVLVKRLII